MLCFMGADKSKNNKSNNTTKTVFIIVAIPLGIILLLLIGLCSFHIYLRITGKTTRERLKNKKVIKHGKTQNINWAKLDPVLFNPRLVISSEQANMLL